ncbi:MAG: hypothetical protein AMXMBFR33_31980 [Candidatus Xenobia bacterium]
MSHPRPRFNRFARLPEPLSLRAPATYTGQGVTIAVLDADFTPHPDLTRPVNRIKESYDATGQGKLLSREVTRWQWHGTMTSVVAAGNGYLSDGYYRGLAYESDLVLVKTADDRGLSEENVARALRWVLDNRARLGIRVVNLSIQANEEDISFETDVVDQLAEEAVRQGIVVVAAAGNTGRVPTPPANSPSVITVGGLDRPGGYAELYPPSSYGQTADGLLKPELVATAARVAAPILPGTRDFERADALTRLANCSLDELPDLARELRGPAELSERDLRLSPADLHQRVACKVEDYDIVGAHYKHVEGTSFAAPLVTSTAALMLQANPDLNPLQVKQILAMTAERLPNLPVEEQGFGRVNPRRAVELAASEPHIRADMLWFTPPHAEDGKLVFQLFEPTARSVELAADFTDWARLMMRRKPNGLWRLDLPAPQPGPHRYKYVVDGVWLEDPCNGHREPDGMGGLNSLIFVG